MTCSLIYGLILLTISILALIFQCIIIARYNYNKKDIFFGVLEVLITMIIILYYF